MKYYKNVINAILGKYIILTFILIGVVLAVIGMFAFNETSKLGIMFTNLGSVIIGGGFFSALTKTKHYTEFFQNRIFEVFFNPAKHISDDILKDKWLVLTKNILHKVTNNFHEEAANELYERYLDLNSDYHYSNMLVTYDIELNGNIINAKQTMKHNIVTNADNNEIIMEHSFSPDLNEMDSVSLRDFYLNNEDVKTKAVMEEYEDGSKKIIIKIDTHQKKEHQIERTISYIQDIKTDPFLLTEYSRFIKGLEIRYKGTNCNVTLIPMGKNDFGCSTLKQFVDQDGYTRAVISAVDKLTLPWQGITLLIRTKEENIK